MVVSIEFSPIPLPVWILTFDQDITDLGVSSQDRFLFDGPGGLGPPASALISSGRILLSGGKALAPQTSLAYLGQPPVIVGNPGTTLQDFAETIPLP